MASNTRWDRQRDNSQGEDLLTVEFDHHGRLAAAISSAAYQGTFTGFDFK